MIKNIQKLITTVKDVVKDSQKEQSYQQYKIFLERTLAAAAASTSSTSEVVFIHTILVDEEREIIGEYTSKNTRVDLTRICIPADSYEWRFVLPGPEFEIVASFVSGGAFKEETPATLVETSILEEEAVIGGDTTEAVNKAVSELSKLTRKRMESLTSREALYGKIDPVTNLLRIIDQRLKTTKPSGRECGTYSRGDLIVFIILLDPEADAYFVSKFSGNETGEALAERLKEEDEKGVKENEKSIISYTDSLREKFGEVYFSQLDSIPNNVKERIFKLGRVPREFLCGFIRNILEVKGRLVLTK